MPYNPSQFIPQIAEPRRDQGSTASDPDPRLRSGSRLRSETVKVESREVEKEKHDRKTEKKCIKCKEWHPKATHFGIHPTSNDGRQSICKTCKGLANKEAHKRNIRARLRHHMATRCLDQLGERAPSGFTRNIEDYLGYSIARLVRALRERLHEKEGVDRKLKDALNEGYHVDHIRPLSSFDVMRGDGEEEVDWDEFRRCWAVSNLEAIPALDNLKKGARYSDTTGDDDGSDQGSTDTEPKTEQRSNQGSTKMIPEGVRFP